MPRPRTTPPPRRACGAPAQRRFSAGAGGCVWYRSTTPAREHGGDLGDPIPAPSPRPGAPRRAPRAAEPPGAAAGTLWEPARGRERRLGKTKLTEEPRQTASAPPGGRTGRDGPAAREGFKDASPPRMAGRARRSGPGSASPPARSHRGTKRRLQTQQPTRITPALPLPHSIPILFFFFPPSQHQWEPIDRSPPRPAPPRA